jgi:GTP-binding protein
MADQQTSQEVSEEEAALLEAGRLLFAKECKFVMGMARLDQMPAARMVEVAFAGRSNVGKSSLINALTGRNTLARASNTPGRTQQINFFDLDGRLMLVDLPGYGYAQAPKGDVEREVMTMLDKAAVPYQIIFTKIDKIKASELDSVIAATDAEIKKRPAAYPIMIATSSEKGTGIPALRASLTALTQEQEISR